jgi:hypothetical protein
MTPSPPDPTIANVKSRVGMDFPPQKTSFADRRVVTRFQRL